MAKKLKTNSDLVNDLMNYSPYGAMCQPFIIEAITSYCKKINEWEPTPEEQTGLVNPDTWKGISKDIEKRMNEFYNL